MKAEQLGRLSALMASVCCVTPLALVLLGLGSLGIGAALGRFHWWFLLAATGLLTSGWRMYFKEQGRCRTTHCQMEGGKATRWTLIIASAIVAGFAGLNLYTYAGRLTLQQAPISQAGFTQVVVPVEGMTCLTCELTIETSLKHLAGVSQVDARVAEQAVYVSYDPARVSPDELIAAINKTGYRASRPQESRR